MTIPFSVFVLGFLALVVLIYGVLKLMSLSLRQAVVFAAAVLVLLVVLFYTSGVLPVLSQFQR